VRERPRRSSAFLGYALIVGAATSWGAQSVVAKLLLTSGIPELSPASLISARTALASVILAGALALVKPPLLRVHPTALGRLAVLGIGGMALSQFTYYVALARLPVATTLLITYTAPLFVLAASVGLLGEPLARRDLAAAAGTLVGAALVVRAYEPAALRLDAVGIGAAVVCALCFAFYSMWGKRVGAGMSPWTMLTYSLAAAAAFWVPLAPPWRVLGVPHPPWVWVALAVVVVFGTLVPFSLYLAGLARLSAAHASVTATVEPVIAAAVAYAVLGERLEPLQLAGGAVVLGSIALLRATR
jgi:drug/metabolite transporter (DMT)-like permease